MRGQVDLHGELFHTFNLDELIPMTHPLRAIKCARGAPAVRSFTEMDSPDCGGSGVCNGPTVAKANSGDEILGRSKDADFAVARQQGCISSRRNL